MNYHWRYFAHYLTAVMLALALCACGSSPWRFNPGGPETPSGLVATAGDGQVSLSWSRTNGAASYAIRYSTSPGVAANSAAITLVVKETTATVPGLANGTRYYFVVSAVNATGESVPSSEATAIPSLPGPFLQTDLQGTWRFNALVTGANAKWLRGSVGIDGLGAVTVTTYLDSSGATVAPAGLFGTMTILPDGTLVQDGAAPDFHGMLSANLHKDLMVITSSAGSTSRMLLILQKSVPGSVFLSTDIQGTGSAVAGPLAMVYHQLSSGAVSEWETASIQAGRDQKLTYLALNAPTPHPLPGAGSKVAAMAITADGTVTESSLAGVVPQPAALLTGVMSADKMTIVGTATDARGAFLLRVIQLIHPPATLLSPTSYLLADLAGSYGYQALVGGPDPLWVYGTQSVGATGGAGFTAYLDAGGSLAVPASVTLAMDQQGLVTDAGDPSYNGQFAYFKDMIVATRTDAGGASRLSIALRRPN